ncbi:hypothetical protein MTR67_011806 [Solanum verrucosum]|uniref:Putative plant transposon protein domain-containing protein n=1 Tax=Solanum verrucosum TaxID=315347 RepID=A0AAF0Q7S5_SOLVR|nr:hypothetical protein MTR67_011806 [Solanum verrucosum]
MGIVRVVLFETPSRGSHYFDGWSDILLRMERTQSVQNMELPIIKATLSFGDKLWWSIVRTRLSLTQADNVVTWDRAVMCATLLVGLEVDFAWIILAEIHERAFRKTTTIPLPCLIFYLCREVTVPIWHCDKLVEVTKTVDVGLIQDDINPAAPHRSTPVIVAPLGTY